MAHPVKFFNSDIPGAPQVSGTAGAMIAMLDAVLIDGFGLQSVTTASVVSGVCTLNYATTPSAQVGTVILVAGAMPSALNGEQKVLSVASNSVTFATAEADTTPTGTITTKVAPAGWVKEFSATNKAVYHIDLVKYPSAPAARVRIDDTTTYNAKIHGYTAMTDVDTGTGDFPTAAQINLYVCKSDAESTATRPWMVVADDRFVYVGIKHYTTSITSYGTCWFGFGAFKSQKQADAYAFMVTGNVPYTSPISAEQTYSIAGTAGQTYSYVARSYTGIGAGLNVDLRTWLGDWGGSGSGSAPLPYPNPADYGLYLCPADVFETTNYTYRGRLPGMLLIPHNVIRKSFPDAKTAYLDSDVPALPGKTVGFMPCAYSGAEWGVVAFDLTGPWEH